MKKRRIAFIVVTTALFMIIPGVVLATDERDSQQTLSSLSEERIYDILEEKNVEVPEELRDDIDIKSFIKWLEENPDAHLTIGWVTLGDFAEACSNAVKDYNHSEEVKADVGASKYTLRYSTVHSWKPSTMKKYRCYAYSLGKTTSCQPGDFSGGTYNQHAGIAALANLVKDDLKGSLGYNCVKIQTTRPSSVGSWYNVIAVKKDTTYDIGSNDYHFAKLSDSKWYHKPGKTAVLKFKKNPTNSVNWTNEAYDGAYHAPNITYDSDARYILYKRSHGTIKTSWTGQHYHSGSKHYFKYEKKCGACGKTINTYWTNKACSGPPCSLPKATGMGV